MLWIFETKPWQNFFYDIWRHGWRSVDVCSVLYKEQEFFSYRDTVHLLFSFLLLKTIKSVFLPRYESLKLNHDTNYLMTSEDTVEDPLMSVQFHLKNKSFFFSCYSSSTVFIFIARDASICISTTLWIFKTKPWHKLFDEFWRHVVDPMMSNQFHIKSKSFFISCYSPSTVYIFIAKDA